MLDDNINNTIEKAIIDHTRASETAIQTLCNIAGVNPYSIDINVNDALELRGYKIVAYTVNDIDVTYVLYKDGEEIRRIDVVIGLIPDSIMLL